MILCLDWRNLCRNCEIVWMDYVGMMLGVE